MTTSATNSITENSCPFGQGTLPRPGLCRGHGLRARPRHRPCAGCGLRSPGACSGAAVFLSRRSGLGGGGLLALRIYSPAYAQGAPLPGRRVPHGLGGPSRGETGTRHDALGRGPHPVVRRRSGVAVSLPRFPIRESPADRDRKIHVDGFTDPRSRAGCQARSGRCARRRRAGTEPAPCASFRASCSG